MYSVWLWWISHVWAFPIDREKSWSVSYKIPCQYAEKSNRSLIMFPSGSRHSTDVKGRE